MEDFDLRTILCSQGSQTEPKEPKESETNTKFNNVNVLEVGFFPLRPRYTLSPTLGNQAMGFQDICALFAKEIPIHVEKHCLSILDTPFVVTPQVYFKYTSSRSYENTIPFPAEISVSKNTNFLIWLPQRLYENIEFVLLDEEFNYISKNSKKKDPLTVGSTYKFTRRNLIGLEVKIRFKLTSGSQRKLYRFVVFHNSSAFQEILYVSTLFAAIRIR
jgi:hypothetical protein